MIRILTPFYQTLYLHWHVHSYLFIPRSSGLCYLIKSKKTFCTILTINYDLLIGFNLFTLIFQLYYEKTDLFSGDRGMMRGLAGGMGGGGRRGWTVRSGMDRLLSGSGGSTTRRCTGSGVRRSCIERRYSLYPASASRTSVNDLLYCCCSMMSRCCANDACSNSSRSLSASSSSCNTQQLSYMR